MEKDPDSSNSEGTAGKSARDEYQKRVASAEKERIQAFGPTIGKFLNLVMADSKSTSAWDKGNQGEVAVGIFLDKFSKESGFFALQDRRSPGSKANIDHILITDRGVFVIDAKNYKGMIQTRSVGGIFSGKETLFIANKNQTKLVEGVKKQVQILEKVLEEADIQVSVIGMLAFFGGNFPILFKPKMIDGVLINGKGIQEGILSQPLNSNLDLKAISNILKVKFPAK
jgi:hypothetical protein